MPRSHSDVPAQPITASLPTSPPPLTKGGLGGSPTSVDTATRTRCSRQANHRKPALKPSPLSKGGQGGSPTSVDTATRTRCSRQADHRKPALKPSPPFQGGARGDPALRCSRRSQSTAPQARLGLPSTHITPIHPSTTIDWSQSSSPPRTSPDNTPLSHLSCRASTPQTRSHKPTHRQPSAHTHSEILPSLAAQSATAGSSCNPLRC